MKIVRHVLRNVLVRIGEVFRVDVFEAGEELSLYWFTSTEGIELGWLAKVRYTTNAPELKSMGMKQWPQMNLG